MCNYIHSDSRRPKKRSGKAYKLCYLREAWRSGLDLEDLLLPVFQQGPYQYESDGYTHWKDFVRRGTIEDEYSTWPTEGDGFACFPTKKEAFRLLRLLGSGYTWKNIHIFSISYRGAFARHMENNILSGFSFDILLIKEFKPLKMI